MSERIYAGFQNLAGHTFGTINVSRLVSRRPVLWECTCSACGSRWNTRHESIREGMRCANGTCNLTREREQFEQRKAEQAEESSIRTVPVTRRPPMSERERQAARAAQSEIAAIEEMDRLERERPLRAAEDEYKRVSNELATLRKDVLLNDIDPEYTYGLNPFEYSTLPQQVKSDLTVEEWNKFVARNSETFNPSRHNFDQMCKYLLANKVGDVIVGHDWQMAHDKLLSAGLLEPKPGPIKIEETKPAPKPNGYIVSDDGTVIGTRHFTPAEQDQMESSTYRALIHQYEMDCAPVPQAKARPGKPATMEGLDIETGERRLYTQRQIDAMDSDTYRRTFISTQEGLRDFDLTLCRKNW